MVETAKNKHIHVDKLKKWISPEIIHKLVGSTTLQKTQTPSALADLNLFIAEVNRCDSDFQWIREKSQIIAAERDKRQSTGSSLPDWNTGGHFEIDDDGGDFWYNNFRRSECDRNSALNHCKRHRIVIGLQKEHFDEPSHESQDLHFANDEDQSSIKSVQYYNEEETRYDRDLNDQESPKKNDLSHEANYKLSKFEQEHQIDNQSQAQRIRRKRSIPKPIHAKQSQGRPIAILANDPIDRSKITNKKIKKEIEESYDEEIAFPEPMLAEQVLKNLGINSVKNCSQNEQNPTEEVLDDEDLLLTTLSTEKPKSATPKKNRIGITLELRVNNVTKQKFEAVTHLRRRKKSATNEIDLPEKYANGIENLRTGNVPNEVVSAVFELVRSNEMLKNHVGPMLDMKNDPKFRTSSIEAKQPKEQKKERKRTEGLLKNVMAELNDIILKQVNEQTCIQLKPEVREYVDRINEFRELQRKSDNQAQPSQVEEDYLWEENTKKKRSIHFQGHRSPSQISNPPVLVCSSAEVREKFRVLFDLVRKFEKLSAENRQRSEKLNAYVQQHLLLLDELQSYARTRRQTNEKTGKDGAKTCPASDKYETLVRTAAFIRKNTVLSGSPLVGSNLDGNN